MRAVEKDGLLEIRGVADFHLDHVFDCGQCFRWEKNEDGSYSGIACGRILTVDYDDAAETLLLQGATKQDFDGIWRRYFDLDRDYALIKRRLSEKDPVIRKAISCGQGIRILNQEKWETLVSFIISQNNNIPRIKKCIAALAETLGTEVGELRGKRCYNLPSPEVLAGACVEDLAPCKLGYRARYLIRTAQQVQQEGVKRLEQLGASEVSAAEALEALQGYCGVGGKVASCISLFSMGKTDSFPIDVWVKKAMNQLYGIQEQDTKTMAEFARDKFGIYGGFAQQYLFYYITHNNL